MAPDDITILLQRFDDHEKWEKEQFAAMDARLKSVEITQNTTGGIIDRIEKASATAVTLAAGATADAVALKEQAQRAAHDAEILAAIHQGAAEERAAALIRVRNIDKFFGSNILKFMIMIAFGTDVIAQLLNR